MLSCVQGLSSVQGTTIRDVSDPTANQDEQLFCHHVFKFICIKLSKCPLLGDVDLQAPKELELGPADYLNHMFLALQLGADIDIMTCPVWTLVSVPWGFPNARHISVRSLDRGQHASLECPLERVVSKVPMATCTGNRLYTLPRSQI